MGFHRQIRVLAGLSAMSVLLAVPLLVFGVQGRLFSPNNMLPGAWRYMLGLVQVGIALAILYGAFTRPAAVLLALVWLVGIVVVGGEQMLENAHYLGFAAFFFLAGRGPHAIDRLLVPELEPPRRTVPRALPVLRVGVGLSLIVVAFTEKLARLDLAVAFLREHPLNFTPYIGIPTSDATFATCAGAVELLIGLLMVFGFFPRVVIVLAWIPFNTTQVQLMISNAMNHLEGYPQRDRKMVALPGPRPPSHLGFTRRACRGCGR
jgi:uncharacterized membrane protein YphA (DoxX/SURF4 family)